MYSIIDMTSDHTFLGCMDFPNYGTVSCSNGSTGDENSGQFWELNFGVGFALLREWISLYCCGRVGVEVSMFCYVAAGK